MVRAPPHSDVPRGMDLSQNQVASRWSPEDRLLQRPNPLVVSNSNVQASDRTYYTSHPHQDVYTDIQPEAGSYPSPLPLGFPHFNPHLHPYIHPYNPDLNSLSPLPPHNSRSPVSEQPDYPNGRHHPQALQHIASSQWRLPESYQQRPEPNTVDQAQFLPQQVAAYPFPLSSQNQDKSVNSQAVPKTAIVTPKTMRTTHQPHLQMQSIHHSGDVAKPNANVLNAPLINDDIAHGRVATSAVPPFDYHQLLLALAEDYIAAAHRIGYLAAFHRRQDDLKQYYAYVTTGLSCIETLLNQFRLDPFAEAYLTLHYCNTVFQETLNHADVDKWLSKAIPLCERSNFIDLKYAMLHLSTRALFVTNPRLAIRAIDAHISSAEAYDHVPWVYALRLLRTSLSFEHGIPQHDFASAVQNLRAMSRLAARDDEAGVSLLSAVYEAMLHLRSARATCVEDARRAIAAARSLQLHPLLENLDQIWLMLACVEVMCDLLGCEPILATQKAEQMASLMDDNRATSQSNDDGILHIPLQGNSKVPTASTYGIFHHNQGRDSLVLQWLPRHDLWVLGFLLNVIATQARTFSDQKVEVYIREGLKIIKENLDRSSVRKDDPISTSNSLVHTVHRISWWFSVQWCFQVYLTINACSRAHWEQAQTCLDEARNCPEIEIGISTTSRQKWEVFLQATILQGMGHTDGALSIYQLDLLHLSSRTVHKDQGPDLDISILSTLNTILILTGSSQAAENDVIVLHEFVGPFISSHANKSLRAAHELLRSILHPQGKMVDKKKHFQNCLAAARTVNNTQLISIALSLMCTVFFTNVIGDQAQKSVNSTRALADRSRNMLWSCVAAGLQEHTALRHSKEQVASFAAREVEEMVNGLPSAVKVNFLTG